MSKEHGMGDEDKIARLDEAMIDHILSMSTDEALDGVSDDDIAGARADLEMAEARLGRARLMRAKANASLDRARPRGSSRGSGAEALRRTRQSDRTFDRKLTLAARSGGADYEADRQGIEEDLEELTRWADADRSGA